MSMKGKTGGWTKWGGRRYDLLDNQKGFNLDEWFCQSCGDRVPGIITPMKWKVADDEYVRVCPVCFAEGCMHLMERLFENPPSV
jgi:rubrerythrin